MSQSAAMLAASFTGTAGAVSCLVLALFLARREWGQRNPGGLVLILAAGAVFTVEASVCWAWLLNRAGYRAEAWLMVIPVLLAAGAVVMPVLEMTPETGGEP